MVTSFCTTCCNRLSQLKQVFPANLEALSCHRDVEWVLLNYNSRDGLDEYIMSQIAVLPHRLVYARITVDAAWHIAVAKNCAHRLGSGDVLMNLDCDNLILEAPSQIQRLMSGDTDVVHLWSGKWGDGTCGRIAIKKGLFHALGGYDESFLPMCFDDRDLLLRAKALGAIIKHAPYEPDTAILNSREDSVLNCQERISWDDCLRENKRRSELNISEGRIVANDLRVWGGIPVETFRGGATTC